MLRAGEAAEARWAHVSRSPDGSGTVLVPFSKTDVYGEGAVTYISRRIMESLDRLQEFNCAQGLVKADDDRIFRLGTRELGIHVREACSNAGLVGDFGTHSMRIGMAQELTLAGFGLVLIMLAGRWESLGMPAYYIPGQKASESAVARLHRMWNEGRLRAGRAESGYDVLSTYNAIRYGGT